MSVVAAQAFFCFPFDFQFPIGWPTAKTWRFIPRPGARDQNPARNPLSDHHSAHKKQHHVITYVALLFPPNPKSTDVMSRPPKPYRCESAPMSMDQSAPMSMDPCPESPLTPSPLTPCPGPQNPKGVLAPTHLMVPCPGSPLTPSPLTPGPGPQNPKGVSLCLCSWSRAPSPP